MRTAPWLSAQVRLVGAVECRSPDQLTTLTVGPFEIGHRDMRRARASLSPKQRELIAAYIERHDQLIEQTDENGRRYWRPLPPEMRDDEPEAFAALWRALAELDALHRLPPRPVPPSGATTHEAIER